MGTIKSSESLALAEYLRAQRETSQIDVDTAAERHGARVRYETHRGPRVACPSAH